MKTLQDTSRLTILHDAGLFWPVRLREIEPGSRIFVTNSACKHIPNLPSDLKRIAMERDFSLVVSRSEGLASWLFMRPADLVLTIKRDIYSESEQLFDNHYLMVNILKNRNGPNNHTFWYKELGYGRMDRTCAAWC